MRTVGLLPFLQVDGAVGAPSQSWRQHVNHLSRILAAVDFSKPARDAFDYALALSQLHGAELIAIQAVPTNETFAQHARARLTLAAKLRHQAEQAGIALSVRVQTGDPAEIILLHARSLRPDVIVVGTHQRRGLDRLRLGSVAERVVARATVPVLLVPRGQRASGIGSSRHIAVAADFSAGSTRATEHALALAKHPGDRISLIHVLPASSSRVPLHLYGYGLQEHEDPSIRDVQRRLRTAVPAEPASAAAIDAHVVRGDAATEISQIVNRIGADLLIVGVTARGLLSRALFGTTAARVLKLTPVPMLAVPDPGLASTAAASTAPLAA
jgi:nucleotide-binding universal stress UspA family protein